MKQEEKAKAYDEAVKKAREIAANPNRILQLDDFEELFPGISDESEDERIRKELIEFIQWSVDRHFMREDFHQAKRPLEWIAYLEKQKPSFRQIHDGIVWDSGLRTGIELEKQKEQKPMESISQLTVQGKGVYKICPRCKERMVRDDSVVYPSMPSQHRYECPKCGQIEFDTAMYDNPEMEEQKPVDLSEMMVHKEPYIAPVPTPMITDEQKPVDYEAELKKCKHNYLYFWDKYVTVKLKPAKWSDEDRLHYVNVLEALEFVKGCKSDYDKIEAVISDINWLKSLPERFNLQPKQEWSEEDINDVIERLELAYKETKNEMFLEDIMRLKSLRSQPKQKVNNMITPNKEFFQWIYDRLVDVHKENPNVDYMISFKRRIEELSLDEPSWKPSKKELNLLQYLAKGIDIASHERHVLDNMIDKLTRL